MTETMHGGETETRVIYRVETKGGIGPYHGPAEDEVDGRSTPRTPAVYHEPRDTPIHKLALCTDPDAFDLRARLLFGFRDMQSMRAWFTYRQRRMLTRYDYCVGVYEVPAHAVWDGTKQLTFDPDRATRLNTLPLVRGRHV